MRIPPVALAMAAALLVALAASSSGASEPRGADGVGQLRREKARLTEMKRKAEAAAEELDRTLRQEKTARDRVEGLKTRLARQRTLVARIDRKLAALSAALDRAEGEVRGLEEQRERARRGLAGLSLRFFLAAREKGCPGGAGPEAAGAPASFRRAAAFPCAILAGPAEERLRDFAVRAMSAEAGRYEGLSEAKERKEDELSGIERRLALSERTIEREKRVGETLLSRRQAEEVRLAGIETRKKRKEKELREIRARVARLEAVVVRIERKIRVREGARATGRGRPSPRRFASLPGGLAPPLEGRVVSRFGRQRDPVFDVTVESHGVEIEAAGGAPVRAVGTGEVVFTGSVSGFGKVLILSHGGELYSVYGKAAFFSAKEGEDVTRGQVVGALPPSPGGKSVLYLELRAEGTAIDPVSVIPLPR